MSLEAFYQCVPVDCRVLERSIQDQEYGQLLVTKFRFQPQRPHPMWQGQDVEFCRDLNAMLQSHPGLESRNLTLGTGWDILEYYISPARRAELFDPPDSGRLAIRGEAELASHLRCTQGVPIRITPPQTVNKILAYLTQTPFKARGATPKRCTS